MENTYYTPELEEFHIGFECELKPSELNSQWGSAILDKSLLNGRLSMSNTESKNYFRVKYLDKADIESCGWVYEGLISDGKLEIYGNSQGYIFYRLVCPSGESAVAIFKALAKKGEGNLFSGKHNGRYELKLRNKSEFKRIMRQLGIKTEL